MRWMILLVALLLIVSTTAAQTVTPTVTATPAPLDPARTIGLPVSSTGAGFPQVGSFAAPASAIVFVAVDDVPSQVFYNAGMAALIDRAAAGEVLITVIPLLRDALPNARGATRAALCAGEQGAFFPYYDRLVLAALNAPPASDGPFAGETLTALVRDLGLDLTPWQGCMISERPDQMLELAQAALNNEVNFTALPYVTINGLSSLTDPASLAFTVDVVLRQAAARATAAVDPAATPDPDLVTLEPLMGDQVPPPLTIDLPDGWQAGYDVLVLQDIDAIRNLPFAVYTGPVTGGQGTIVLLWAFPNLLSGNPLLGEVAPDLWADGTRLLRLAIVEAGCNIGTDLRREYPIGGLTALGTSFAAVDCPALPDTRGWFAGLQQFDLNFVFYAFAEPITALDGPAEDELQAILDTVQFVRPPTPTPTPTPTP